ncbi:DUF7168 domain-containing protein [Humitalea sp. 24SJ18S-53]|uniref:DUF7168 domain-containing protein n=1 Tax=Humitalea sp. 24SJ18S-53 TaxID=3422307 RepID=UPI003D671CA0
MTSDRDALRARIRALLSRTQANGCTEAEALAAAERAFALMREHGLDEDSVACARLKVSLGRKKIAVADRMWPAVAWACHCEIWTETGGDQPRHVVYFGRAPWPEVAIWLHGVVDGAARRASRDYCATREYKRRRTAKTRRLAREHFLEGFVASLRVKIIEMKAGDHDVQMRDLAVAKAALEQEGLKFSKAKAPKPTPDAAKFGDARDRGVLAAMGVDLGWGIGGPAATKRITP